MNLQRTTRRRVRIRAVFATLAMLAGLLTAGALSALAANASQGGCSAPNAVGTWVEGFNIGTCINDRGTDVGAYPDSYINYVPTTGQCHIQIQLWDDNNHQYGNKTASCAPPSNPQAGQSWTFSSPVTIHAYARLDLDGPNGSHFWVGDSQKIRLGQGIDDPGGCNTFVVQGFSIGICINDRHTTTTAYPDMYVNYNPVPELQNCNLEIQTWGDNNNQYGPGTGLMACPRGPLSGSVHLTGVPVAVNGSVHAYTRLDLGAGSYSGPDSPPITTHAPPEWFAHANSNGSDHGDPINVVLAAGSTRSMAGVISALSALPGRTWTENGKQVQHPWTEVSAGNAFQIAGCVGTGVTVCNICMNILYANPNGGTRVQQDDSVREGGCDQNALFNDSGIDHFRAWRQASTGAWFIAASTEHYCLPPSGPTHCVISYDTGQSELVADLQTVASNNGWTFNETDLPAYKSGSTSQPDGSNPQYSGIVKVVTLT